MVKVRKGWVIMNCPIFYQMIMKDMYSSKQDYIDVVAFCTDIQGDMVNCKFGVGHPETTISQSNIKSVYARTGPIYKLLYF
jgi:hypothetical protein